MKDGSLLHHVTEGLQYQPAPDDEYIPDADLRAAWEAMITDGDPHHPLPFSYCDWLGAMMGPLLPCAILDDIDSKLQGYEASHGVTAQTRQLTELKSSGPSAMWKQQLKFATEYDAAKVAEQESMIRDLFGKLPEWVQERVLENGMLDERMATMRADLRTRFELNKAFAAVRGESVARG